MGVFDGSFGVRALPSGSASRKPAEACSPRDAVPGRVRGGRRLLAGGLVRLVIGLALGLCAFCGGAAVAAQVAGWWADLYDAVDGGGEGEVFLAFDDVLGAEAGAAASADCDGGCGVRVAVEAVHGVLTGSWRDGRGKVRSRAVVVVVGSRGHQRRCSHSAT